MYEETKKINTNQILQEGFSGAEKLTTGLESFIGSNQLMTKGFGDAGKNIKQQTPVQPNQTNANTVKLMIPKDN